MVGALAITYDDGVAGCDRGCNFVDWNVADGSIEVEQTKVVRSRSVSDHGLTLSKLLARADLATADSLGRTSCTAVARRHHNLGVNKHAGAQSGAATVSVSSNHHDGALPFTSVGDSPVDNTQVRMVEHMLHRVECTSRAFEYCPIIEEENGV